MKGCLLRRPAPIGTRPLEIATLEDPVPGPGQILLAVRACGVCRTDLHVVEGDLPPRKSPVIPGHQAVGGVVALGEGAAEATGLSPGDRAGVAWLGGVCGACRFCLSGRENLCDRPDLTGWTVDGGFAELMVASARFAYRIPDGFPDLQAAPLLCAGIIGYRALAMTGLGGPGRPWERARLGLYGFGAAGHVAIQMARARGAEVYVCTRDRERHQSLAAELGAAWVGDAAARPPLRLDAAIIFAPAGELVPVALAALDRGGTLVLGGIHMSPIPSIEYAALYGERTIVTVTNNTREDGRRFLEEAARISVRTCTQGFPLDQANEALAALKNDAIKGAAVLTIP